METLQRTANRGSISTGYDIDNSLKLEADNSEKLSRSQTTGTNRKKFTVSFWVKRSELGALQVLASAEVSGNDISFLDFESDDFLRFRDTASASDQCILQTNRVFRDTSAWYHIVLRVDTTDGTADDRNRIYVNGVQETSFSARTNFDLNDDTFWGYNGGNLTWGNALGEANYYSGYTAEAVYVDGLSLAPTSFGEFDEDTGIWKPIDVSSLTFGNNGYYLDFEDSSNLGNDASGGTDFTLNNITSADQATDTPTNNFATTNPIPRYFTETFTTEGATVVTKNANGWVSPQSTICPASGKWYMEFKFNAVDSRIVGAAPIGGTLWDSASHYGGTVGSNSVGYADTGYLYVNDSGVNPTYGPAYDNSNIIAVALDMNNGYIYWAKDNTWINTADPVAGSGGYALPAGLVEHSIGASVYQQAKQSFANFGGYTTISISSAASDANGYGTFEYAPPSGYYALCTKNLAEFG
jgi:hypothetical protein